ncbi:MAG: outer membrane protein assembly factor BamA [Sandaracinus sp.]|nr:outer membrane protein assembly factor BamA [Sandaracinus sp.]
MPPFLRSTLLCGAVLALVPFGTALAQPPVEAEPDEEVLDEELEDEEGAEPELDDEDPELEDEPELDEPAAEAEEPAEEPLDDSLEPYTPEETQPSPRTICQGKRIRNVRVTGAQRIDPDDIRATMDLRSRLPCTDAEVAHDARAIWDLGFFDDLQIEADAVGEQIDLTVRVVERPAIARVVFRGNDEVDDEDIEEKLTLQEGAILSLPDVKTQVTKIRDLYAEEGYFLARITYDVRRLDNDRNEVEVRFLIDEGEEVTVRRIRFLGNQSIDSDELNGFMQTSETGFFSFISDDDKFANDVFEEDVQRLQAYYYDQGFLAMQVGVPRIEMTADRRFIDITVPIEEGPRFRIGEMSVVEIDGNGAEVEALEDDLRDYIDLESGDWFSRTKIGLGLQEITRIYRDEGYARVELNPETDLDEARRIVDVRITIVRGPPVRIERIDIRGNTKTRDSVLRREIRVLEGELYDQSELELSKQRLLQLRYFERVDVSEETGSRPDLMVLTFEVQERPTGTFQVGAGFSSIESFIVTAQIQQQNLFGNGQSLSLNLQLSGIRQFVQLRFVEPWLFGSQWSLGLDVFKTIRQFSSFNRDSTGGGITFGHPIGDPRLRLYLQYRAEQVDISPRTGGFFQSGGGGQGFNLFSRIPLDNVFRDGLTSSLQLTLTWDSRTGSPFRTTGGAYVSASTELAESFLGSDQIFWRNTAFARWYKPIWGPFLFRANLELGLITSRSSRGVPIYERYYLGGIFNVRGYRLQALGPRAALPSRTDPNAVPNAAGNGQAGGISIGGNVQAYWNLEVEFPIVEAVGIFGVVFTDGGNAWNLENKLCQAPETSEGDPTIDPCGVNPFSIRTSVGFGLRWISPLGPLRFEWGIPLARREYEDKIRFEFTIGTAF